MLMLTYNRPQLIGRAVASVVRQSCQDWELIVVQDGSNEHTVGVMSEWAARDGRIVYLRRDKGGNIADATNYGLARARGEYVAILDDDDAWIDEHKLARQVEFLDAHPDHAGCGGGAIVVDGAGAEQFRYRKPVSDADIRRRALYANPMVHSTGIFRRAALERIGRYDASLAGFQDWDVWLKLLGEGKLANFDEPLVYYTLWEGGGSFSNQRRNTESALKIVLRHRHRLPGFAGALAMATAYYLYSFLPVSVKQATYQTLSRLKKQFFAPRVSAT
ncbi:MAG: glycosyltransferase family 2 protein [Gammaproteobacteria bacterium]|nr:glycosyltransferase family 2 protein [Gammaproteobacteria bacterium]